ncbi:glycosyltransferase family 4 protein [Vibrio sp. 1S139]|uniref:glycosyltransferase family 4 protein n=1 Tax=Vibrio sp. 1S139 TaxID=3230006 RepID=UPI00352E8ECE
MKITILHRYFWPQNYPYATMLRYITEQTVDHFDEVEVLSSYHNQEEKVKREEWAVENNINCKGINLKSERGLSLPNKVLTMLRYWFWLIYQLATIKTDVVMVATTPPVFTAMLVRFFSKIKKYNYIYHCQDIHPESSLINGNIKDGFFFRWLRSVDKNNVNEASLVICLSSDMKKTLVERGSSSSNIKCINNFIFEGSPIPTSGEKDNITRFLFAGTLGHFQNLGSLFKVIEKFDGNDKVEFHIMGDGPLKSSLVNKFGYVSNLIFHGMRPIEDAISAMDKCDFGIVTLSEGITQVAYPSKSIMYLSRGLPILACVDVESDVFKLINDNVLGLAVCNSNHNSIEEAINKLIVINNEVFFDRKDISDFANNQFGKDEILSKFNDAFREVSEK